MVFFDLKNAFDRASHTGILFTFCQMGLRGNCLHYIYNSFQDRQFKVLMEDQSSNTYDIETGVPQGSVLSPLLFSVLMSNIPQRDRVSTFCFSDDVAYCITADCLQEGQQILQDVVNDFHQWSLAWGMHINANKSKFMCFTRKKITFIPNIKIGQETIPMVTEHKFLGLILDAPLLTWKKHIVALKESCTRRLDIMKCLASKFWGASRDSLIIFYKTYIRSKIDYGSIVYGSASSTTLKMLDVVQSSALRIATGTFKTAPIVSLQAETNILPLSNWRTQQTIIWYQKIQNYSGDNHLFQLYSSEATYMYNMNWPQGRQVPFIGRAKYHIDCLHLAQNDFTPIQVTPALPPWFPLENIIRTDYPLTTSKKEQTVNTEIERVKFYDFCEQHYQNSAHIYTDGSHYTAPESTTAAIFIPEIDFSDSWHLPPDCSIITAELSAIWQALLFIIRFFASSKVVVFVDSLNPLLLIKNYNLSYRTITLNIQECILEISRKGGTLMLQWIPSHYGIPGNEMADEFAKMAHNSNSSTLLLQPFADLRTPGRKKNH